MKIIFSYLAVFGVFCQQELFKSCGEDQVFYEGKCEEILFKPSKEFQPVKPFHRLPEGLHIRINLLKGIKEAKLMEEKTMNSELSVVAETKMASTKKKEENPKVVIRPPIISSSSRPTVSIDDVYSYQSLQNELLCGALEDFSGMKNSNFTSFRVFVLLERLEVFAHQIDIGADMGKRIIDLNSVNCNEGDLWKNFLTLDGQHSLMQLISLHFLSPLYYDAVIRSKSALVLSAALQNNEVLSTWARNPSQISPILRSKSKLLKGQEKSIDFFSFLVYQICVIESDSFVQNYLLSTLNGIKFDLSEIERLLDSNALTVLNPTMDDIIGYSTKAPKTTSPAQVILEKTLQSSYSSSRRKGFFFLGDLMTSSVKNFHDIPEMKINNENICSFIQNYLTDKCGRRKVGFLPHTEDEACPSALETIINYKKRITSCPFNQAFIIWYRNESQRINNESDTDDYYEELLQDLGNLVNN